MLQAQEEEEVIVLDEVDADSVPIEESILATTRPITSVYGTDRSILDTPRNVNIISREQLDAISIKDVRDFSKLTSSSYTKSNFGAPTTPNLRGQEGDLMINGIRRGHSINGNGVPINFNSVESVNIVKGPAGAVYGTSNYVGGYADLITKRAYFEDGGKVSYSYGTWDQHTYSLDYNKVVSDTMAYRASIGIRNWGGYWDRWYDESESIYLTFAFRPSDTYSIDIMGEYYSGNYTENWGINRVTQDLLDNSLYLPNAATPSEYVVNYQNNPPVGYGNTPFGQPTEGPIVLDMLNPVPIERSGKLSAPGDDSVAEVIWLQAIQEKKISDSLTLTNNTYFHYKDRETFSSYHYSEYLPHNWSIENRLQLTQDFETESFESVSVTYGLRLKYQEIESVNHFYNEPVNYYDMTGDPNLFRVPDSSFDADYLGIGPYVYSTKAGRGVLDYWYVGNDPGAGGTDLNPVGLEAFDTESFIYAPFFQADIEVNDKFSVLFGGTIDYVEHKDGIPEAVKFIDKNGTAGTYNASTGEFVPGDTSDDTLTDLDYTKVSTSSEFYNANVSFVYKPTEASSVYFTYNEGEHFDSNTGGALKGSSFDEDLTTELAELGTNIALFDGKAYLGAALFSQEYTTQNSNGSTDRVFTDGFEIEFNYQPNRNLFATIGYSYLDSKRTAGFLATATSASQQVVGESWETPTFPSFLEGATFETPGCPPHLLNALVQYKFDNGFGVQANIVVTSAMQVAYNGGEYADKDDDDRRTVPTGVFLESPKLGAQYEIDLKLFYEYESWLFEFSIFNATDEDNWDLPNTGYALGSVVGRPERNYQIGVSYSF
ncbi:MAG: hypothetical protein DBX01_02480 [Puniceicoccaceae bacterium]|nr:MAG: hypothetical protein DBX01_02480 [Puniceicoccaceae bacterium]